MGDAMNSKNDRNEPSTLQPRYSLLGTLKRAFRHIADPDHRENAVEWLFSDSPICWEDLEANFPTLSRYEAALHLVGRLQDRRKRILYETIFSLHPGLKYTLNMTWPLNRSPEEDPDAFLAGVKRLDEDVDVRQTARHSLLSTSPDSVPSYAIALNDRGGPKSAESQHWTFLVRREDVSIDELATVAWSEEATAQVEVTWLVGKTGMEVAVSGPLAVAAGRSGRTVWATAAGQQRTAEGRKRFFFPGPVEQPADDDSLTVEHLDAAGRVVLRWTARFEKGETS